MCGAVIQGTVEEQVSEVNEAPYIYLNDAKYYKGCGPSRVKIRGYGSGSACSIYPPSPNKKIIVFVCKLENEEAWTLNTYKPYAGQLIANRRHMRKLLDKITDFACSPGEFKAESCGSSNKKRNINVPQKNIYDLQESDPQDFLDVEQIPKTTIESVDKNMERLNISRIILNPTKIEKSFSNTNREIIMKNINKINKPLVSQKRNFFSIKNLSNKKNQYKSKFVDFIPKVFSEKRAKINDISSLYKKYNLTNYLSKYQKYRPQ